MVTEGKEEAAKAKAKLKVKMKVKTKKINKWVMKQMWMGMAVERENLETAKHGSGCDRQAVDRGKIRKPPPGRCHQTAVCTAP